MSGNDYFGQGSPGLTPPPAPPRGASSFAPSAVGSAHFGTPTGGSFAGSDEFATFAPFAGPQLQPARRSRFVPLPVEVAVLVLRLEAYLTAAAALVSFGLVVYAASVEVGATAPGQGQFADATPMAGAAGSLAALLLIAYVMLKIATGLQRGRRWAAVIVLVDAVIGVLAAAAYFLSGLDATSSSADAVDAIPAPWGAVAFGVVGAVSGLFLACLLLPSSLRWFWSHRP